MNQSIPLIGGKAVIVIESEEDKLSYTAPLHHGNQIQFYACLHSKASMCNVATEIFRELQRSNHRICLHNYFQTFGWADPGLLPYQGIDRQAPIGLFLGLPTQVPEFFFKHEFRIGCFVCESTLIPEAWVYFCNRMDLIVVPSNFCASAFKASGVTAPIMVVPHGLEPEFKPYADKQRGDKLVFFNTFYSTSLCHRKSLVELVRSFQRAFEGRRDVILRLRTDQSDALENCRQKYPFGDLVELDLMSDSLPLEDYARIFSEVHCTVHPSKGEGFGLVPFQSIACETPVLAPHATGMADYLDVNNSLNIKTGEPVAGEGVGNAVGTYYSIDEDHLVEQLRYMADNWEAEYQKVRQVSSGFRQRYSWTAALAGFAQTVDALLALNSIAERQSLVQKHCSN